MWQKYVTILNITKFLLNFHNFHSFSVDDIYINFQLNYCSFNQLFHAKPKIIVFFDSPLSYVTRLLSNHWTQFWVVVYSTCIYLEDFNGVMTVSFTKHRPSNKTDNCVKYTVFCI